MTNFNFKSQVCTDKVQSERLLALGLKKETSDMSYDCWKDKTGYTWYLIPKSVTIGDENSIPAWSLDRLIEMMPRMLIDNLYHEYWDLNITPALVIYRNQDEPNEWIGECMGQGMYNNIIDCIEWLIKKGYFPKEYLVCCDDNK